MATEDRSYPFAIVIVYEAPNWVACVGPYATQARTLKELLLAVHDMLHGLVATCDAEGIEIPFGYPLIFEAIDKFRQEARHAEDGESA